MTVSLSYLTWVIMLAVFQVFFAAAIKRRQDGLKWGMGKRDIHPMDYIGLKDRSIFRS
jgi:uncharacterized MAPEG superfamily protein